MQSGCYIGFPGEPSEPHLSLQSLPALRDNYIWMLSDAAGHALVVDPGESAPVDAALREQQLQLHAILLTHHHPDHIGGAAALRQRHGARVYAPHDPRIEHVDQRVAGGDCIQLQTPQARFEVIAVPGHTTSHIAYHGEGLLFCGDTLFSLGCGRMFEGTPAQMLDSLQRLAALPAATRVCCGHEYTQANATFARTVTPHNPALAERSAEVDALRARGQPSVPSRLHQECAANPFLRVDSAEVIDWAGPDCTDATARFAALRAAKDQFRA